MSLLRLWMGIAGCVPGTGFDDLPPTAEPTPTDDTDSGSTHTDTGLPPAAELVINEVLADPPAGLAGDANCDGSRGARSDAFVEIVNVGTEAVDLGGATLSGLGGTGHVFAAGLVLGSGRAVVVFGGGDPTFDGTGVSGPWCGALPAEVTVLASSAGGLGLRGSGDTLTLADRHQRPLDTASWGEEGARGQSLNRDPELGSGTLVLHTSVSGAAGAFSPGTLCDGSRIVLTPTETGDTGQIEPPEPVSSSIDQVQAGAHPVGTEVEITGITTAVGVDRLYLELSGGGPGSGVVVLLGEDFEGSFGPLSEGDVLRVVGQVREPNGITTVDLLASAIPSVTVTGRQQIPAPLVTTAPELLADPEPWEGVLVEIVDLVVTDPIVAGNGFDVADFAGAAVLEVDDQLTLYGGYAGLVDGDRFEAIRGPLSPMGGRIRIEPRRDSDLVPAPLPELRINEILTDPPLRWGDANCDGVIDPRGDDFVELWNVGVEEADLTGLTLSDSLSVRHTFPAGTRVGPGASITVFDGGSPRFDGTGISGTWCTAAVDFQVASSGTLGLSSGGDTVTVASGSRVVESAMFGAEAGGGTSINRDPDLSLNAFVPHDGMAGAINALSPGTAIDGVPPPYRATITVDGDPADFPVDSAFVTSSGTVSHIAWDGARIYLSMTHEAISAGGDQWLVVYFGNGIGGTTDGFPIGGQQPALPFSATHAVRWAADGSADGLLIWDGVAWDETTGWLGTRGSAVADDDLLQTVELALPIQLLGAGSEIGVVMVLVSDAPGLESTFAATPNTAIPNGTPDPDYAVHFRFAINLDTPPSAYSPVP